MEVIAIFQDREDEGSNEGILKVELTDFATGLHVGYNRKERSQG